MDNDQFFAFAHRLAEAAAAETLPRFRTALPVVNKDEAAFDPVTEADRAAEKALRALIEDAFPDHGIRGEEFPEKAGSAPWRWILDPVDGTRAFICGVPVWTTLIGLEHEGRAVFGIVDQPVMGERWVASTVGGSRIEPSVTKVSGRTEIGQARLMVTDMRAGEYFSEDEAGAVGRVARAAQVTRQGLDSYAFGLLASGHFDLIVEAGLQWHDIAAVIPVVEAAGGVVTDWAGRPVKDTGGPLQVIAAASRELAEAASGLLEG